LGGKDAQMQSDLILFEQAIVDKCLPLAIEYMGEFHTVVSQELRFLTSGTLMKQHTISTPVGVRMHTKRPSNSNHHDGKEKKNRKQHMTHNINIRIELLPRRKKTITRGNNGAWEASVGWDAATGLGSPNATVLSSS